MFLIQSLSSPFPPLLSHTLPSLSWNQYSKTALPSILSAVISHPWPILLFCPWFLVGSVLLILFSSVHLSLLCCYSRLYGFAFCTIYTFFFTWSLNYSVLYGNLPITNVPVFYIVHSFLPFYNHLISWPHFSGCSGNKWIALCSTGPPHTSP